MTLLRHFWSPGLLTELCERVFSSGRSFIDNPGKFSSGGARQLFDWDLLDYPELWNACRAHLPPGPVVAPRVIRYGDGVELVSHVDQGHTRMVVLARAALSGGQLFVREAAVQLEVGDAVVFNDAAPHSVSKVQGERWTVTMGVG